MILADLWCHLTYRKTPGQRAWERGIADAIPWAHDRDRELYLTDADEVERRLNNLDDAKERFVFNNRLFTARLPQPESGRVFARRARSIGDYDFAWKEAVVALLKEER